MNRQDGWVHNKKSRLKSVVSGQVTVTVTVNLTATAPLLTATTTTSVPVNHSTRVPTDISTPVDPAPVLTTTTTTVSIVILTKTITIPSNFPTTVDPEPMDSKIQIKDWSIRVNTSILGMGDVDTYYLGKACDWWDNKNPSELYCNITEEMIENWWTERRT